MNYIITQEEIILIENYVFYQIKNIDKKINYVNDKFFENSFTSVVRYELGMYLGNLKNQYNVFYNILNELVDFLNDDINNINDHNNIDFINYFQNFLNINLNELSELKNNFKNFENYNYILMENDKVENTYFIINLNNKMLKIVKKLIKINNKISKVIIVINTIYTEYNENINYDSELSDD